eukprot:COSAG02_NODE_338_length_24206_cov_94.612685_20_plen_133_part_00
MQVAVVGELATQSYNSSKNKSMFLQLLVESLALEFVLFYGCTAIRYSRIQREHKLGQIAANPWILDFALILGALLASDALAVFFRTDKCTYPTGDIDRGHEIWATRDVVGSLPGGDRGDSLGCTGRCTMQGS